MIILSQIHLSISFPSIGALSDPLIFISSSDLEQWGTDYEKLLSLWQQLNMEDEAASAAAGSSSSGFDPGMQLVLRALAQKLLPLHEAALRHRIEAAENREDMYDTLIEASDPGGMFGKLCALAGRSFEEPTAALNDLLKSRLEIVTQEHRPVPVVVTAPPPAVPTPIIAATEESSPAAASGDEVSLTFSICIAVLSPLV